MGGSGSGRRPNYCSRKDTVDDYLILNLNCFRKRGKWKLSNGNVTWSRGGVATASIGYLIVEHSIYFKWQNTEGQVVTQTVGLTIVQQWIGVRYYFICPRCQRRVINLYAGSLFFCRHCYNLTYESCRESGASHFGPLVTRKRFHNFGKALLYSQELKQKRRVGTKMLMRLHKYIEKSGINK
jgi:hypothetical protein